MLSAEYSGEMFVVSDQQTAVEDQRTRHLKEGGSEMGWQDKMNFTEKFELSVSSIVKLNRSTCMSLLSILNCPPTQTLKQNISNRNLQ